ncbi:hypothetical protein BLNAU_17887 [Blattamonas nauphoetae]|uniref:Uncharacterized protein n=1 Tax=Blattamonas nauphoetae TaxID=2049346 RepID=A0ABQ9X647_9EUKA|nr:hypothetical protein BLNAU_17887 [Blattamonas nauphoetae]
MRFERLNSGGAFDDIQNDRTTSSVFPSQNISLSRGRYNSLIRHKISDIECARDIRTVPLLHYDHNNPVNVPEWSETDIDFKLNPEFTKQFHAKRQLGYVKFDAMSSINREQNIALSTNQKLSVPRNLRRNPTIMHFPPKPPSPPPHVASPDPLPKIEPSVEEIAPIVQPPPPPPPNPLEYSPPAPLSILHRCSRCESETTGEDRTMALDFKLNPILTVDPEPVRNAPNLNGRISQPENTNMPASPELTEANHKPNSPKIDSSLVAPIPQTPQSIISAQESIMPPLHSGPCRRCSSCHKLVCLAFPFSHQFFASTSTVPPFTPPVKPTLLPPTIPNFSLDPDDPHYFSSVMSLILSSESLAPSIISHFSRSTLLLPSTDITHSCAPHAVNALPFLFIFGGIQNVASSSSRDTSEKDDEVKMAEFISRNSTTIVLPNTARFVSSLMASDIVNKLNIDEDEALALHGKTQHGFDRTSNFPLNRMHSSEHHHRPFLLTQEGPCKVRVSSKKHDFSPTMIAIAKASIAAELELRDQKRVFDKQSLEKVSTLVNRHEQRLWSLLDDDKNDAPTPLESQQENKVTLRSKRSPEAERIKNDSEKGSESPQETISNPNSTEGKDFQNYSPIMIKEEAERNPTPESPAEPHTHPIPSDTLQHIIQPEPVKADLTTGLNHDSTSDPVSLNAQTPLLNPSTLPRYDIHPQNRTAESESGVVGSPESPLAFPPLATPPFRKKFEIRNVLVDFETTASTARACMLKMNEEDASFFFPPIFTVCNEHRTILSLDEVVEETLIHSCVDLTAEPGIDIPGSYFNQIPLSTNLLNRIRSDPLFFAPFLAALRFLSKQVSNTVEEIRNGLEQTWLTETQNLRMREGRIAENKRLQKEHEMQIEDRKKALLLLDGKRVIIRGSDQEELLSEFLKPKKTPRSNPPIKSSSERDQLENVKRADGTRTPNRMNDVDQQDAILMSLKRKPSKKDQYLVNLALDRPSWADHQSAPLQHSLNPFISGPPFLANPFLTNNRPSFGYPDSGSQFGVMPYRPPQLTQEQPVMESWGGPGVGGFVAPIRPLPFPPMVDVPKPKFMPIDLTKLVEINLKAIEEREMAEKREKEEKERKAQKAKEKRLAKAQSPKPKKEPPKRKPPPPQKGPRPKRQEPVEVVEVVDGPRQRVVTDKMLGFQKELERKQARKANLQKTRKKQHEDEKPWGVNRRTKEKEKREKEVVGKKDTSGIKVQNDMDTMKIQVIDVDWKTDDIQIRTPKLVERDDDSDEVRVVEGEERVRREEEERRRQEEEKARKAEEKRRRKEEERKQREEEERRRREEEERRRREEEERRQREEEERKQREEYERIDMGDEDTLAHEIRRDEERLIEIEQAKRRKEDEERKKKEEELNRIRREEEETNKRREMGEVRDLRDEELIPFGVNAIDNFGDDFDDEGQNFISSVGVADTPLLPAAQPTMIQNQSLSHAFSPPASFFNRNLPSASSLPRLPTNRLNPLAVLRPDSNTQPVLSSHTELFFISADRRGGPAENTQQQQDKQNSTSSTHATSVSSPSSVFTSSFQSHNSPSSVSSSFTQNPALNRTDLFTSPHSRFSFDIDSSPFTKTFTSFQPTSPFGTPTTRPSPLKIRTSLGFGNTQLQTGPLFLSSGNGSSNRATMIVPATSTEEAEVMEVDAKSDTPKLDEQLTPLYESHPPSVNDVETRMGDENKVPNLLTEKSRIDTAMNPVEMTPSRPSVQLSSPSMFSPSQFPQQASPFQASFQPPFGRSPSSVHTPLFTPQSHTRRHFSFRDSNPPSPSAVAGRPSSRLSSSSELDLNLDHVSDLDTSSYEKLSIGTANDQLLSDALSQDESTVHVLIKPSASVGGGKKDTHTPVPHSKLSKQMKTTTNGKLMSAPKPKEKKEKQRSNNYVWLEAPLDSSTNSEHSTTSASEEERRRRDRKRKRSVDRPRMKLNRPTIPGPPLLSFWGWPQSFDGTRLNHRKFVIRCYRRKPGERDVKQLSDALQPVELLSLPAGTSANPPELPNFGPLDRQIRDRMSSYQRIEPVLINNRRVIFRSLRRVEIDGRVIRQPLAIPTVLKTTNTEMRVLVEQTAKSGLLMDGLHGRIGETLASRSDAPKSFEELRQTLLDCLSPFLFSSVMMVRKFTPTHLFPVFIKRSEWKKRQDQETQSPAFDITILPVHPMRSSNVDDAFGKVPRIARNVANSKLISCSTGATLLRQPLFHRLFSFLVMRETRVLVRSTIRSVLPLLHTYILKTVGRIVDLDRDWIGQDSNWERVVDGAVLTTEMYEELGPTSVLTHQQKEKLSTLWTDVSLTLQILRWELSSLAVDIVREWMHSDSLLIDYFFRDSQTPAADLATPELFDLGLHRADGKAFQGLW